MALLTNSSPLAESSAADWGGGDIGGGGGLKAGGGGGGALGLALMTTPPKDTSLRLITGVGGVEACRSITVDCLM